MASPQPNAPANDGTMLEFPADNELMITRSFKAPMRLVFEALSKPEHVKRWWAPASRGQMHTCEIDFRVGGGYRFAMRANGGFEVVFYGKYLEIQAPTRMVQTEVFEPFPDAVNHMTVTLTENRGVTTMAQRSVFPSKMVRDQVLQSGMEDGMRESMVQLTAVVASLA